MFNKIQRLLFTLFFIIGGGLMVYGTVGAVTYIMVPQGGTGVGVIQSGSFLIGSGTGPISTSTKLTEYSDKIGIGTTTPAYTLDVYGNIRADGDVRTTGTFYGDTWSSITANSMNIKPSGDEDDFLSFKTVANRPTIKVEGDKKIYVQSSDSDEVGIEYYKDASHSGAIIYYKNEELFGLTSQDSMVFKVCGDYDDYVTICNSNNTPELSVASSSAFKINAGGTNSLLLNHDGGNVGIGTTTPAMKLSVQGDALADSWNVYSNIYQGSAISKLNSIKPEKGKKGDWVSVDHDTLPEGVVSHIQMDGYVLPTMSIDALAQMNTKAVQELYEINVSQTERIESLEADVAKLYDMLYNNCICEF